jgi:hypothetical protein
MTTPTDADLQAQVLAEVGDPNGTIAPLLPVLWTIFADKALIDPALIRLYAKRSAIEARMAEEQGSIDFSLGQEVQDKQSQRFTHLVEMRAEAHAEILRIEAIATARRVPQTGALTATTPTTPPTPESPDANSALYQGSPYKQWLPW